MFITFEGIDGSGKTTQAERLAASLRRNGREVTLVREPGGTPVGERVRSILLDVQHPVAPIAEVMLFSAARAQLASDVIRPALAAGGVVVADRFYDSTTAYQGGGRGLFDAGWMESLHARVTGGLTPDLTFLIDVPVDVAVERRSGRDIDRMEAGGSAFFERVRNAYLDLARRHRERVHLIDGTRPPEEIGAEILSLLNSR
jgi:dTMP kinase